MVNGGTHVKNNETISGYFEGGDVEALNFGTMMYSMDQCLLSYRHDLHKYQAKVVVVGLDLSSIGGLNNDYIPLRMREERNMPYLKPRYELTDGKLRLIPVHPEIQLARVPNNPELFDFLRKNDHYYDYFSGYCRMGLFPLSAFIRFAYHRVHKLCNYFIPDSETEDLLLAVMDNIVQTAREHGACVIFIMMPSEKEYSRRGIQSILPDLYSRALHIIRSGEFNVIDARQVLLLSRQPTAELFHEDGVHYKPLANRLIAQALRDKILPIH